MLYLAFIHCERHCTKRHFNSSLNILGAGIVISWGFPGGSEVKASACNVGDLGSIPGSGRSPGEGNGNPLQYSCLENPMNGRAWWATVHGVAKSWTRLSYFTFTYCYLHFTDEKLRGFQRFSKFDQCYLLKVTKLDLNTGLSDMD